MPKYRIEIQNVPQGATEIEMAAYVQNALTTDSVKFDVTGPLDKVTVGLNLGSALQGDATISVVARRTDGCPIAVGTSDPTAPSSTGSDVVIPMTVLDPALSDTECSATPRQTILGAIRKQEGPLDNMRYSMLLQGWEFKPSATVTVTSTANVQCATDSACNTACPTTCLGALGSNSAKCLTDCTVVADVVHTGPGLIELSFDPNKNILQQSATPDMGTMSDMGMMGMRMDMGAGMLSPSTQPVDLLLLLSRPLSITLKNGDAATAEKAFTETGMGTSMALPPPGM